MGMFGGSSDGGAAAQEAQRQASINQGMQDINRQFAGFTPAFYQKAATDYTNAVTPGMLADYHNTKNDLTYALARGGNLNSSAAVQRNQSLQNTLSQNESQIANNAQQQSNTLQAAVNTQKGQLVNQLQSSADPASIAEQATAATSQLRADSPVQPLGNLFADWSQQYLTPSSGNSYGTPGTLNPWNTLGMQGYGGAGSAAGSSYMAGNP